MHKTWHKHSSSSDDQTDPIPKKSIKVGGDEGDGGGGGGGDGDHGCGWNEVVAWCWM